MTAEEIWSRYQSGVNFKSEIDLYEMVAKNERFFAGDQWAGVNAPDLPKPVVNFIKKACQQKIAEVASCPVRVSFSALEFGDGVVLPEKENIPAATDGDAQLLNGLFESDWDRLGMDSLNLDGLTDACISGDYLLYNYWDDTAETGQAARGRVCVEIVDNVNYYPADPNDKEIQRQRFIILARREPLENVRREASLRGIQAKELEKIGADEELFYQSGDLSQIETRGGEGKCITLLYLFRDRESGHVFAQKSTRDTVIRPQWDTGLTRYPLAMMNWENRKNCCHGRAEVTGLVPVQRYVNQMYAMCMLFTMQSAFPKPVYNQGMVKAWSTAIGTAIPVSGDINTAVKYLDPPGLPEGVMTLPETLMKTTLELVGVNELSFGSVNPVNMGAIQLARQISSEPIQTIQSRLYAMLENFARNWLDMIAACYKVPRWVKLGSGVGSKTAVFDAAGLRGRLWSVKIDVGPSTAWSEINSVQTLSGLFQNGVINAKQYVERLPDGYLPMKDRLLRELNPEKEPDGASSGSGGETGE